MISADDLEETLALEKIAIDEPSALIGVLPSDTIVEQIKCLGDQDDSDDELVNALYGFAPNDKHIMTSMNRILDLGTRARYRGQITECHWTPVPEQKEMPKKRRHTSMEKTAVKKALATVPNKRATPRSVPKRRC